MTVVVTKEGHLDVCQQWLLALAEPATTRQRREAFARIRSSLAAFAELATPEEKLVDVAKPLAALGRALPSAVRIRRRSRAAARRWYTKKASHYDAFYRVSPPTQTLVQAVRGLQGAVTVLQIKGAIQDLQHALHFDQAAAGRRVLELLAPIVTEIAIKMGVAEADFGDCVSEVLLQWCEPHRGLGLTAWGLTGIKGLIRWNVKEYWRQHGLVSSRFPSDDTAGEGPSGRDEGARLEAHLMMPPLRAILDSLPERPRLTVLVDWEVCLVRVLTEADLAVLERRSGRPRAEIEGILARAKVFADAIAVLHPASALATEKDRARRLDTARKDRQWALAEIRRRLGAP